MGLKSLIKVAEGKNAANVSFEDKFIKEYEAAVHRQDERERQGYPSDYFRPSSMYGCERMLFSRECIVAQREIARILTLLRSVIVAQIDIYGYST